MFNIKFYRENGKYVIDVSGKAEYDLNGIGNVEKAFEVDVMTSLADAERKAVFNEDVFKDPSFITVKAW